MPKTFTSFIILIFCFASGQTILGQSKIDVKEFEKNLKHDYKEANIVAYVNIRRRILVDSIGEGNCEKNEGVGYCLYRLKAELKEVYKGKIRTSKIEFYESLDTDYPKKYLMGEKVVFLSWGKLKSKKKKELFTLENSTRSMEHNVLRRIRKITGRKS
jgi:hypothetical protein